MQQYTLFENLVNFSVLLAMAVMAAAAIKYLFPPKRKSNPEFDKLLEMVKPFLERLLPKQDDHEGTDDLNFVSATTVAELLTFIQKHEGMPNEAAQTEIIKVANVFLQEKKVPYVIVKTNRGLIVREL